MDDLISRQAALNCFHDWVDKHGDVHSADEMPEYRAIEALPSAQPEQIIKTGQRSGKTLERAIDYLHSVGWLQEHDRILTASAQRKGKWTATKEWGGRNYSCSCCKFSFIVDTCMLEPMWNFCPNCGAEMVKGEEDENNNQI